MVEPHAAVPGRTAGTLTGRYLLVLSDDLVADHDTARSAVAELTGLSEVTSSRDDTPGAHPTLFARLGVAVAELDPARLRTVRADRRVLSVEPERVLRALSGPGLSADYLRGFADAAGFLAERAAASETADAPAAARFADNDQVTWGLQATGADVATTDATTGADAVVAAGALGAAAGRAAAAAASSAPLLAPPPGYFA